MTEEMKLNRIVCQQSVVGRSLQNSPSKAHSAIIDVDKTQVGSGYPNIAKVDNELIACVRT